MEFLMNMQTIFLNNINGFLRGTFYTILISLIGTFIGLFIGMVIGIVRTIPKSKNRGLNILLIIVKTLMNIYVQVLRGTPMIVQATLFYYGLQQFANIDLSSLNAAFIVVSINTGAYMAEVVRGGIISIDDGQFEAASALGMNHVQTMVNIILPQAFRNIIPAIGNEFIINIKDTSVLNVISVNELFFLTKSIAGGNFMYFETYLITSMIYLILTLSIASILHYVEKRIEGPENYDKNKVNVLKSTN